MIVSFSVLLLSAAEPVPLRTPEAAKPKLICREDSSPRFLFGRRRLCLTETEWQQRLREDEEASRRSIFELMGDTACLSGGICTRE